jgi:G3E family GTPase
MKTTNKGEGEAEATSPSGPRRKRCVVIGGFLGAGKTSAILKLGEYLKGRALKVGIITNDHGEALADTPIYKFSGFHAGRVQGGCYSDAFENFGNDAEKIGSDWKLDVMIAETIGTCIEKGLGGRSNEQIVYSPISVVLDPHLGSSLFGLNGGPEFSEKVAELCRTQLREAEFIVINKIDLLSEEKLEGLNEKLKKNQPHAQIFSVSTRTGEGLKEWFDCIMSHETKRDEKKQPEIEIFNEAEASLAWLNCTLHLSSVKYWEASKVLMELGLSIQGLLQAEGGELAHLKMTLLPDEEMGAIATANIVRSGSLPEISHKLPEPLQSGELILNLRAEADPELLNDAVNRALLLLVDQHPELFARLEHCEHFRPGKIQEQVSGVV